MASGIGCQPVPDGPSSSPDGPRAVSASPPKPVSLRSPAEFRRVLAIGHRRRVGDLVVVRAEGEPGTIRYGLVAGRRIGTAVSRNRAKRRLRQAVLAVGLEPGFDYVLVAGDSTPTVPFPTLVTWLKEACDPQMNTDAFGAGY